MKKYSVAFLPLAREDLRSIVLYIHQELHAPEAALALAREIEHSISALAELPYRHALYRFRFRLASEVRCLPVKNYLIFYVVREPEQTVEIQRILYGRTDTKDHLQEEP